MFGRFFGARYFARRYFGDGGVPPPVLTSYKISVTVGQASVAVGAGRSDLNVDAGRAALTVKLP